MDCVATIHFWDIFALHAYKHVLPLYYSMESMQRRNLKFENGAA